MPDYNDVETQILYCYSHYYYFKQYFSIFTTYGMYPIQLHLLESITHEISYLLLKVHILSNWKTILCSSLVFGFFDTICTKIKDKNITDALPQGCSDSIDSLQWH